MTAWLLILGFAVSSSLDNLGVGISYGIRGIRIGVLSNVMIAIICFIFSMAGIISGQWLSKALPGIFPALIGAFILFIVGLRIVLLAVPRKKREIDQEIQNVAASELESPSDGGSLKAILQNPEKADVDQSGSIGLGEAVVLGIALSVNAITNGLGAGLLGLSPLAISLAASVGSFVTVWFGVALGRRVAGIRIGSFTLGQFGMFVSGAILLGIAGHSLL